MEAEWFTTFWANLTHFGDVYIFAVILIILYYAINKRAGYWVGCLLFVSTYINMGLKYLISYPRPGMEEVYEMTPWAEDLQIGRDLGIEYAGPGIPSGHAQGSGVFYGSIGLYFKRLIPVFVFLIPFLIGFSRMYLGVHYLGDVVAGWGLAAVILGVSFYYKERILGFFSGFSLPVKVLTPLIVLPLITLINPEPLVVIVMGLLAGWVSGYVLENEFVGFEVGSFSTLRRIINPIVGILVIGPAFVGIGMLGAPLWVEFCLYVLLGYVFTLGLPWVFETTR